MTELLGGLAPGDVGAGGVLVIVVLMVLAGWLVPKRTVDRLLEDRDATIAAGNETIREQARQINALLDGAQTTVRVVESIQPPAAESPSRESGRGA